MMRTSVDIATLVTLLRPFNWIGRDGLFNVLLDSNGLTFEAENSGIRMRRSMKLFVDGAKPKAKGKGKPEKADQNAENQWVQVGYGRFVDTLKGMTGEVTLAVDDSKITLSQGTKREFKLSCASVTPFTFLVAKEGIALNGALLRRGLHKTIPFVSENELRPTLCGVHIKTEKDRLVLISTDGYTLCLFKMLCTDDLSAWKPITMTGQFATVLKSLDTDTFTIYQLNDCVGLAFEDGLVEGAIIVDTYPNVESMVTHHAPEKPSVTVVAKSDLKLAAKINSIYTADQSRAMLLFADREKVVTHTSNPDFACDATIAFAEPSDMKTPALLSVNGRFLQDIVDVIDCDRIVLTFGDTKNNAPMFIAPAEQHDEELLFLLMPQRIGAWDEVSKEFGEIEVPYANIESVAA